MKKISALLAAVLMSATMVSCTSGNKEAGLIERLFMDNPRQSVTTTAAPEPAETAPAVTTTTTAVTTTALPATEAPAEEPAAADRLINHPYLKDINRNTIIQNDSNESGKLFNMTKYDSWYFYDFYSSAVSGFGVNGQELTVAAYEGIEAQITDNNTLTVRAAGSNMCSGITIRYEDPSVYVPYQTSSANAARAKASADLRDTAFLNGFYEISCEFNVGNEKKAASVYLLVNCASNDPQDCEFFLCNGERHLNYEDFSSKSKRYEDLTDLLERQGVTPEKALTASRHYPLSAPVNNDDTQYWIDLSHKILEGKEEHDPAYKALYLHDWMTSHLSYDEYKVRVLIYQRYKDAEGNTYPEHYVSRNYTGVCLDFSSIYAIMCREYGIPCVVLTNDTHAWNALYLKGRWYEVDLTVDTNRTVKGKDTTDITDADKQYCYTGFCRPDVNSELPTAATKYCW